MSNENQIKLNVCVFVVCVVYVMRMCKTLPIAFGQYDQRLFLEMNI